MNRDPSRPDPDALLATIRHEERVGRRGRLKIYFGFSPGVGKTYSMLEAARRLQAEGLDVVVGIVETHGREETARLLEGMEVLPRTPVAYRGHVLPEFDLDAAIVRRPSLLLVDELAHTNAPGLRHPKRWQDVGEILDSGIDVHTTLNVQHVESLVDLVEETTGVRVRETVPDTVLESADEVELVDLPPDELLTRLREGKIYLPEVARHAIDRFFKRPNLLHLRELALVRMARRVGSDVDESRRAGVQPRAGVAERIVVGVGAGGGSARAIRDCARIAAGLRAEWLGVAVRRPFAAPLPAKEGAALEDNLRLVEALGGRVARVVSETVAAGLLEEARRVSATRIVIGRARRSGLRARFREPILDRLVDESGPIDVIVAGVPATGDAPALPGRRPSERAEPLTRMLAFVVPAVAVAFGVGRMLRPWVDDHDMAVVSLLLVVAATLRFGRGAGILAVVLGALGIDFFFLHPEFQFTVSDTKEVVSLILLLSAGVVVAELVVRISAQRELALTAERRLSRLLDLSRRLAEATTAPHVADALAATVRDVAGARAEVVVATAAGELDRVGAGSAGASGTDEIGVVLWCHEFGQPAGRGTATLPGSRITCLPLRVAGRRLGVVVIGCLPPRELGRDEMELITSAARQVAAKLAGMVPAGS